MTLLPKQNAKGKILRKDKFRDLGFSAGRELAERGTRPVTLSARPISITASEEISYSIFLELLAVIYMYIRIYI